MKLVSTFVLFLSASAFACPQLAGTYNCPESADFAASILTITQQSNEYGITIDSEGEADTVNFLADGTERPVEGSDMSYLATCSADSLTVTTKIPGEDDSTVSLIKTGSDVRVDVISGEESMTLFTCVAQ